MTDHRLIRARQATISVVGIACIVFILLSFSAEASAARGVTHLGPGCVVVNPTKSPRDYQHEIEACRAAAANAAAARARHAAEIAAKAEVKSEQARLAAARAQAARLGWLLPRLGSTTG